MLETPGTLLPGPGAELNATKALAYLAVNQKEKTKIYIDKALQVMPDSNWVRFAHARILIEENSQTKAIPILEKLLQEDPSDGIAWSLLGNTYLTFGKLAEAENAYTQAIANRIKKSADYLRRGITRLKQGKLDTAAGDAEILLKLNPKWIEARYFAGKVKFRQRRFTEAERILEDTYYLNVNHFQVVFLLARTYLALNKLERAEALAENAYHLKPKLPVTRNLLVEIYLRQNKGEKSEELLRPILATYPGNLSTTMALASSLVQQYKNAEAEALLLHALQSDPSNLEARVALAHFYLSRNETKRVIDLLQGWDVKRAQKILERVIEKSPNSAKAHYGLARINMILGNPREADNLFRKALELESQK